MTLSKPLPSRSTRWRSSRKGQALVEFILVLPILTLFLLGIVTFGLTLNAQNTIQQAVRVGTRAAALGEPLGCPGDLIAGNSGTVYGWVDSQLAGDAPWLVITAAGHPIPVITYAAAAQDSGSVPQTTVWMTVMVHYHPLLPIPGLLPATLSLAATYQMIQAQPPPVNGSQNTLPTGSPYDESTTWTHPTPPTSHMGYFINPSGCAG